MTWELFELKTLQDWQRGAHPMRQDVVWAAPHRPDLGLWPPNPNPARLFPIFLLSQLIPQLTQPLMSLGN